MTRRMNVLGRTMLKAFNKNFEWDGEDCWIKEKKWKRGMSTKEVINQVKAIITRKKPQWRFRVEEELVWTKPWVNGIPLAKQEFQTPKYDVIREIFDERHLVVLDEEVIDSLCELLKGLQEKGFRVNPSHVFYNGPMEGTM